MVLNLVDSSVIEFVLLYMLDFRQVLRWENNRESRTFATTKGLVDVGVGYTSLIV